MQLGLLQVALRVLLMQHDADACRAYVMHAVARLHTQTALTVAAKVACVLVVGDKGVAEGALLGPLMALPFCASSIKFVTCKARVGHA